MSRVHTAYLDDYDDTQAYSIPYTGQGHPDRKDNSTVVPTFPGGSTGSKYSNYESAHSSREIIIGRPHSESAASSAYTPASVRSVQGKKAVKAGYLYCLIGDCKYQTRRQYDMDRHEKRHTSLSPERKVNCPARGCGRTGEDGFVRTDHLHEHLRKVHAKDIPKHSRRRRDWPEDIRRYIASLEAPSELKGQVEDYNEIPPPGTRVLLGNQTDLERIRSLSSQSPYVAEKAPATASGIERSVSQDMGVVDKESPSPTNLESVRDVQVSPEPKITHGKSISQSVKLGYEHNGLNPNKIERRPSTASADVERSAMMITGEHRVQDAVKPAKIVLEPDNEARPSILDHSVHTTPLAVMDADNELMSSLSDDGSEQAQHSDDGSVVDEDSCSTLNPVEHLANVIQYSAYVTTLLSSRIELRVWRRRAPSPTIHISISVEGLLEDGKQRIRWTCRCGRRLYDDFEELRPGALKGLERMLNEQNKVCSPEDNVSGQHRGSSIRALWSAEGGVISSFTSGRPFRNNNLPTLPWHQPHAAGEERNPQSSATSENLFLLMCIPYRKYGTRLVHMDLAELASDETLFRKLRHEYQSIRGRWASYFSLWKMTEIQFVKFGLHKHQLIDIKEKNDLPPESLKNEYRYQPVPAETIPPIGKNHLMHLYEHPDHADDVPFCLERIPKKLREQLKLAPHQAPGLLGWGVYFAEGFDWPKFWVFGSVILSLSVLFGVCWSTLRQDIQGGFGVTACMMVAVTFTTGVVQAAVEQR